MCYNAVDRHVDGGRGQQPAIIYDSPVGGAKEVITYRELQDQVRAVGGARSLGKQKIVTGALIFDVSL